MMKKIIYVLLLLCLFILLPSCGNSKEVASVITMDVNPEVTFTINQDGKVLTVTGTNDEGAMIICDLDLIDKNIESAINEVIQAEHDCGFFRHIDEIDVDEEADELLNQINEVKINVISKLRNNDTNKIINRINTSIKEKLTNLDLYVKDKVSVVKSSIEEANTYLESIGIDIQNITFEKAVNALNEHLQEQSSLICSDLYNAYSAYKEQVLDKKYQELYNNVITHNEKVSSTLKESYANLYNALLVKHNESMDTIESGINAIDQESQTLIEQARVEYNKCKEAYLVARDEYIKVKEAAKQKYIELTSIVQAEIDSLLDSLSEEELNKKFDEYMASYKATLNKFLSEETVNQLMEAYKATAQGLLKIYKEGLEASLAIAKQTKEEALAQLKTFISTYKTIIDDFISESGLLDDAKAAYDKAVEDYNKAVETAKSNYEDAKKDIDELVSKHSELKDLISIAVNTKATAIEYDMEQIHNDFVTKYQDKIEEYKTSLKEYKDSLKAKFAENNTNQTFR